MAEKLILPGEEDPQIGVFLVEAAQIFQERIDEIEDPLEREEEIALSLGVLGTSASILGGKKTILRTTESYRFNPTAEAPVTVDVEETKFGDMIVKADFNGVLHFDVLEGKVALNSLCFDLDNPVMVKDYDISGYETGESLDGPLLVPVKSVKSALAA